MRHLTSISLLLGSLLGLAGCGGIEPQWSEGPLLDGLHQPDILTERQRLLPPPALEGNRFLQGWHPWKRGDGLWLVARGELSRLEAVNLLSRERQLLLGSRIIEAPARRELEVRVAGEYLGRVPLANPIKILLPADLPLGRFPIDLLLPEDARVAVSGASFLEPAPEGEVELRPGEIRQSGTALVDLTRVLEPGSELLGRFEPPAAPAAGQSFALLLEREGGQASTLFEWPQAGGTRPEAPIDLQLPLSEQGGLARIRLLSRGNGPAGRWLGLRLRWPQPQAAEAGAASPPPPPLVVLYVMDALRADRISHLGGRPGVTPTVDRMAAEGVTFTRHQSVAPNTVPSTKALFTGQAFMLRGHWKLPQESPETLAEVMAAAGYRTAAFSGNGYISPVWGTDRGFQHHDQDVTFREYEDGEGIYNRNAEDVHGAALEWLTGLDPAEPAFLYLHTIHPHNPYDPPQALAAELTAGIDSRIDGSSKTLVDIQRQRREVVEADRERIRALYDGALAYNDRQIGLLIEELRRARPGREILFIVTSDHGEELFEHGGVLHGYTLYREQLQIPLVFWWPERLPPRRVDAATDNLDLHETLRSLVGAPPSAAAMGRPLWQMILGSEGRPGAEPDIRFAAASSLKGGIFSAQSEGLKLIWAPRTGAGWGMGEGLGRSRDAEYLFDLAGDPQELTNLAGEPSLEAAWLRARLLAWIERGKLLEQGAELPEIDPETLESLKALGYFQ